MNHTNHNLTALFRATGPPEHLEPFKARQNGKVQNGAVFGDATDTIMDNREMIEKSMELSGARKLFDAMFAGIYNGMEDGDATHG